MKYDHNFASTHTQSVATSATYFMMAPCFSMHPCGTGLALQLGRQLVHTPNAVFDCSRTVSPTCPPPAQPPSKQSLNRFIANSETAPCCFLGQLHGFIKHAAEPSNKQQKDFGRQDTNNQANKPFENYCQSSEEPMGSQGLCNTLESNLISNLLNFFTIVIKSLALKEWRNLSVAFVVETQ